MTAILQLPQLPQTAIVVATNADLRDALFFVAGDPPAAIDISGIAFVCTVRAADAREDEILFRAATAESTFVVSGAAGKLGFAVPATALANLEQGEAVGDLLAMADGVIVNLSKDNGPIHFTIRRGLP